MIFLDVNGNMFNRETGEPLEAPSAQRPYDLPRSRDVGTPPVKDMTTRTTASATWEQPSPKPKPKAALASQTLPAPKKTYDFDFGEGPMYDMPHEDVQKPEGPLEAGRHTPPTPVGSMNMRPEGDPKEMYLRMLRGQAQEMLKAGIDPRNVRTFLEEGHRKIVLSNPPRMHDPIMEWILQWHGVPTRAEAPKKEGEA